MSKTRRFNLHAGKKRKNSRTRRTRKGGSGYNSAWSYVSSVYGDMNTQLDKSLTLQPGQDTVARQSTQSVPINNPNANVKGIIKMSGGRRRIKGRRSRRSRGGRCSRGGRRSRRRRGGRKRSSRKHRTKKRR